MQISNSMGENENKNINNIEYSLAGLYSAIYSVKQVLKENHCENTITNVIMNLLFKDFETLEKHLKEKGIIYNERKS